VVFETATVFGSVAADNDDLTMDLLCPLLQLHMDLHGSQFSHDLCEQNLFGVAQLLMVMCTFSFIIFTL
jgi:hypothetical protein